jgi:hypothetical protein
MSICSIAARMICGALLPLIGERPAAALAARRRHPRGDPSRL